MSNSSVDGFLEVQTMALSVVVFWSLPPREGCAQEKLIRKRHIFKREYDTLRRHLVDRVPDLLSRCRFLSARYMICSGIVLAKICVLNLPNTFLLSQAFSLMLFRSFALLSNSHINGCKCYG